MKAVQTAYSRPLAIVVDRSRLVLEPRLFSSAYVSTAVAKARIAEPRSNVKLVVAVRGANVRSWVARVTKRFSRQSVDATLAFKGERPVIHGDRAGRSLNAKKLTQRDRRRARLELTARRCACTRSRSPRPSRPTRLRT